MGTEAVWIPLVAAALPAIIGGIGSALAGSSASADNAGVDKAGADKLFNMQKGAQAYGAYRPQMMEAQQKALANQMAQFKPAENMLQSMYGGGSTPGAPGTSGGYDTPLPPGWYTERDPITGQLRPVPPSLQTGASGLKHGGTLTDQQYKDWLAYQQAQSAAKTASGGTPDNPGGLPSTPIYVPPPNMPGGTGAGSSGTSFTDEGGGGGGGFMAAPIGLGEPPPGDLPVMGMAGGAMGPMTEGTGGAPGPGGSKPTPASMAPIIKAMLGGSNVR